MVDMNKKDVDVAVKRILAKDAYRQHQEAHARVERAINTGDKETLESAIFGYKMAAEEGMKRYHAFMKAGS